MKLNYLAVSKSEYAAYLTRKAALRLVGTLLLAGGLSSSALLIVLLILTPAGVPEYTMSAATIGLLAGTAVTVGLGMYRRAAWMQPVRPGISFPGQALHAGEMLPAMLEMPDRGVVGSRVTGEAAAETEPAVLREGNSTND